MRALRTAVAIALISLTVGCGGDASPPGESSTPVQPGQEPNWPNALSQFRFHWTSPPDIDLTAGPAVAVRAYLESYATASLTFDKNNVYPGFTEATPENSPQEGNYSYEHVAVRPLFWLRGNAPKTVPHYGYNTNHLLDLTIADGGYQATVCVGEYTQFVPSKLRPGKYISVGSSETKDGVAPFPGGPFAGISTWRITLNQSGPTPNGLPPQQKSQRGPLPAPATNVFGPWFIAGSSTMGWGPSLDPASKAFPSADLQRRCADSMPDNEAERLDIMTGFKDQPSPPGDAEPGWPQAAS